MRIVNRVKIVFDFMNNLIYYTEDTTVRKQFPLLCINDLFYFSFCQTVYENS